MSFTIDSRYLNTRETKAGQDFQAFQKLTKHIDALSPIARLHEKSALKTLKKFRYSEIWLAVSWLLENGTFPARQRCLFPLAWLAAGADRMRAVLHRASAEQVREHLNDWRRELISVKKREEKRAEDATAAAIRRFELEYPTAPERARAMIKFYNLHRDKFGPLTLEDPAARALCFALIVTAIEALEIAQDQQRQAG